MRTSTPFTLLFHLLIFWSTSLSISLDKFGIIGEGILVLEFQLPRVLISSLVLLLNYLRIMFLTVWANLLSYPFKMLNILQLNHYFKYIVMCGNLLLLPPMDISIILFLWIISLALCGSIL